MIDLLAPRSNDIWEIVLNGKTERLREMLARNPERAKTASDGHTLLEIAALLRSGE